MAGGAAPGGRGNDFRNPHPSRGGGKHLIQAVLPPLAMVKEKPGASRPPETSWALDAPMPPGRPNTLDRASSAYQASDESANPTRRGAGDSDG